MAARKGTKFKPHRFYIVNQSTDPRGKLAVNGEFSSYESAMRPMVQHFSSLRSMGFNYLFPVLIVSAPSKAIASLPLVMGNEGGRRFWGVADVINGKAEGFALDSGTFEELQMILTGKGFKTPKKGSKKGSPKQLEFPKELGFASGITALPIKSTPVRIIAGKYAGEAGRVISSKGSTVKVRLQPPPVGSGGIVNVDVSDLQHVQPHGLAGRAMGTFGRFSQKKVDDMHRALEKVLKRLGRSDGKFLEYDQYVFDTRAGKLTGHLSKSDQGGVWFYSRFEDPNAAKRAAPGGVNPHSGKWNHFFKGKPEEVANDLSLLLARVGVEQPGRAFGYAKGKKGRAFGYAKGSGYALGRSIGGYTFDGPDARYSDRKKIGVVMHLWHGSMGDPIYAVGSYYYDDRVYPKKSVVEDALSSIESMIPRAARGEHGWTRQDAKQLEVIAKYLREALVKDYR